jgi:hypothetical protein
MASNNITTHASVLPPLPPLPPSNAHLPTIRALGGASSPPTIVFLCPAEDEQIFSILNALTGPDSDEIPPYLHVVPWIRNAPPTNLSAAVQRIMGTISPASRDDIIFVTSKSFEDGRVIVARRAKPEKSDLKGYRLLVQPCRSVFEDYVDKLRDLVEDYLEIEDRPPREALSNPLDSNPNRAQSPFSIAELRTLNS